MSVHRFWIPIPDGQKGCCCCGVYLDGITLECGDHFCAICEGRDHHEDHGQPDGRDCYEGAKSPVFRRSNQTCAACEQYHDDWETCAALIRNSASGTSPFDVYRVTNGVVEKVSR